MTVDSAIKLVVCKITGGNGAWYIADARDADAVEHKPIHDRDRVRGARAIEHPRPKGKAA